ncbi:uncharacterized protein LOC131879675 isoform X2 [Tigriopus californicus]|uniref:uncharacterized protein LOC131879675 isoform X2 n=1 Tax=Tigriopus californicus TaxID=6832 RepID=UPI0027DA20C9|nr:uncharacterized protein LOC131879675 isoform X2 [Tigriopus californicus]
MDAQFSIRPAIETDCSEILRLIQELADYEKMPDGPKIGAEVLIGDGFNNAEAAYYHCLVAESQDAPGQLVAYCLYFYTYSTDVGRCVYMEDLYVSPNFRSKGLGKSLWQTLVKNALERDCVRCEFVVLDWNQSSIEFYHLQGAKNMSSQEGWVQLRMNESVMASFKAPKTLSNTKVRRALKSDGPKIWNLIMEQTGMDGRLRKPYLNPQALSRDGIESDDPYFHCLVGENHENPSIIEGYLLYYYVYSTWEGRAVCMEDFYVSPKSRNKGIGQSLLEALLKYSGLFLRLTWSYGTMVCMATSDVLLRTVGMWFTTMMSLIFRHDWAA